MDVSVVIPTKDRLVSLQRVLPSYVMQSEVKEIVVVVDGSTDGTIEFLEQYCHENDVVRYVDNGVNIGLPASRNVGIDSAKFEYSFMGEDDLELTEGFFETLLSHMTTMGADVVCGRNIWRDYHESASDAVIRTNKLDGSYVNMKTIEIETGMDVKVDSEEPILASPMLAKTELFRSIRYDAASYRVNFWREETDFQLSAREHGYKLACCPHAICFNFTIPNDRGGVYAASKVRYEKWVIINNWRFINKHEAFIRDNFQVGDKRAYILKFALGRFVGFFMTPAIQFLSRLRKRAQTSLPT
jgi:glycosyltransferase involved in cell wall biosynthesis